MNLKVVSMLMIGCCLATAEINFPAGDARNCFGKVDSNSDARLKAYDVLPGFGWDNLINVETGRVLNLTYTSCQKSTDRRFLIPDGVHVSPLKISQVDTFAEIISSSQDYKSVTSRSINADAGYNSGVFKISGSFSYDHMTSKEKQLRDDSITARIQERYVRYRARIQPDTELDPVFKNRVLDIAASLALNNHRQARYESQQLVRDFGTHYSISVDAGAALVLEEQVNSHICKERDFSETRLKLAVKASYLSLHGKIDGGMSASSDEQKSFNSKYLINQTDSLIKTFGGSMPDGFNFSGAHWTSTIDENLVAIDRSGEPIYTLISAKTMPEIPLSLTDQLARSVQEAVNVYYKMNTYPGCVDRKSDNFNMLANVDDGSCKFDTVANLTFGGVYQTCSSTSTDAGDLCSRMQRTNPLTGKYSCPKGYQAISLYSAPTRKTRNDHRCHTCWVFGTCCNDKTRQSSATYQTFWCAAFGESREKDTGYMFGGLYTSHTPNLVTSDFSCPSPFQAMKISKDINVCVSDQFDLARDKQGRFAGFFSCRTGNPLALGDKSGSNRAWVPSHWPMKCPSGYSQFMAGMTPIDGCEINYCMQLPPSRYRPLVSIKRPPFIRGPFRRMSDLDNDFFFDLSQNLWQLNPVMNTTNAPTPRAQSFSDTKLDNTGGSVSDTSGLTAGIVGAFIGIVVVVGIGGVVVFVKKRRMKTRSHPLYPTPGGYNSLTVGGERVSSGTGDHDWPAANTAS